MLTVASFEGNFRPPDLDLSQVPAQTVAFGQTLTVDLLGTGGFVSDVDAQGAATDDTIRFMLDPDIGTDTPSGASITPQGLFTWTPGEGQLGTFDIVVIAIDEGTPALADAETFRVTVTNGNQRPTVTTTESTLTYTENGPAIEIDPGLLITDPDSVMLTGAAVSIGTGFSPDEDVLTFVNDGEITGSYESSTGILTLTGTATVSQYQSALRSVQYENTSDAPNVVPRQISFEVSDGEANGVASRTINLLAVNDTPDLLHVENQVATFGQPFKLVLTAIDPDSDNLTFTLDDISPQHATLTQTSNNTALLEWNPSDDDLIAPIVFRVLVTDGEPLGADSEEFLVSFDNIPPNLKVPQGINGASFMLGEDIQFTVSADDTDILPEMPPPIFGLDLEDSGIDPDAAQPMIDASTGVFSWTPNEAGHYIIRILATDNGQPPRSDSEMVSITIVAPQLSVSAVALAAPNHNRLEIGGTSFNDDVFVDQSDNILHVQVVVDGGEPQLFSFDALVIDEIEFHGYGGDDKFINNSMLPAIAYGDAGDDALTGGRGDDVLIGGTGNDNLDGADGDDSLSGGDGDDEIIGGTGADLIYGDLGNDVIDAGPGDDSIFGGFGDDLIDGGPGNDLIDGGSGNDQLIGGLGDDILHGAAGQDSLSGGADNDVLVGGSGDDMLAGGAGDDLLIGDEGADTLDGNEGSDMILHAASDTLIALSEDVLLDGSDTIIFEDLGDVRQLLTQEFSAYASALALVNPLADQALADLYELQQAEQNEIDKKRAEQAKSLLDKQKELADAQKEQQAFEQDLDLYNALVQKLEYAESDLKQVLAGHGFQGGYYFDVNTIGGVGEQPLVGDFNGDGYDDIGVYITDGEDARWVIKTNNKKGGLTSGYYIDWKTGYGGDGKPAFVGDFNGDGYDDLGVYVTDGEDATWYVKTNNKKGGFSSGYYFKWETNFGGEGKPAFVGDFNGDGYDDLGVYVPDGESVRWVVKLNNKKAGFNSGYYIDWTSNFGGEGKLPFVGDFDKDGATDDIGVYVPNGSKNARWVTKHHINYITGYIHTPPGVPPIPIFDPFVNSASVRYAAIVDEITNLSSKYVGLFSPTDIWSSTVGGLGSLDDIVVDAVDSSLDGIKSSVEDLFGIDLDDLAPDEFLGKLFSAARSTVDTAISTIHSTITSALEPAVTGLLHEIENLPHKSELAIQSIVDGYHNLNVDRFTDAVGGLSHIGDLFGNGSSLFVGLGDLLKNPSTIDAIGVLQGVKDVGAWAQGRIDTFNSWWQKKVEPVWHDLEDGWHKFASDFDLRDVFGIGYGKISNIWVMPDPDNPANYIIEVHLGDSGNAFGGDRPQILYTVTHLPNQTTTTGSAGRDWEEVTFSQVQGDLGSTDEISVKLRQNGRIRNRASGSKPVAFPVTERYLIYSNKDYDAPHPTPPGNVPGVIPGIPTGSSPSVFISDVRIQSWDEDDSYYVVLVDAIVSDPNLSVRLTVENDAHELKHDYDADAAQGAGYNPSNDKPLGVITWTEFSPGGYFRGWATFKKSPGTTDHVAVNIIDSSGLALGSGDYDGVIGTVRYDDNNVLIGEDNLRTVFQSFEDVRFTSSEGLFIGWILKELPKGLAHTIIDEVFFVDDSAGKAEFAAKLLVASAKGFGPALALALDYGVDYFLGVRLESFVQKMVGLEPSNAKRLADVIEELYFPGKFPAAFAQIGLKGNLEPPDVGTKRMVFFQALLATFRQIAGE